MAQLQELEIVKRIEQARIESGLSQDEMADLLEVASRTYWNYENNRVPYKLMGRISEITGRSLRWLLHGEDDAEPSAQVMRQLTAMEQKLDRLLTSQGEDPPTEPLKFPPGLPEPLPGEDDSPGQGEPGAGTG
jgi:transcriptional regulator with XRE-family HTH domain